MQCDDSRFFDIELPDRNRRGKKPRAAAELITSDRNMLLEDTDRFVNDNTEPLVQDKDALLDD